MRKWALLLIISIFLTGCSYPICEQTMPDVAEEYSGITPDSLALKAFYMGNDYASILHESGTDGDIAEVNPYVEPQMGWRTNGMPAKNPTKVAADGLSYALKGDTKAAATHLDWLINNGTRIKDAIVFRFDFGLEWFLCSVLKIMSWY